jgi:hypothetical protein
MKKFILLAAAVCFAPLAFSHTASAATCREGSEQVFFETSRDGDTTEPVQYVCENGRFVKKFGHHNRDYKRSHRGHMTCREGSSQIFFETSRDGDTTEPVRYVCENGKYSPVYDNGDSARNGGEGYLSCREGSRESFNELSRDGDSTIRVDYVCENGVYVRLHY